MHDHDFKEGYLTLYLALYAEKLLQIMVQLNQLVLDMEIRN